VDPNPRPTRSSSRPATPAVSCGVSGLTVDHLDWSACEKGWSSAL